LKNNITIAYILTFAKNTWFWFGIWAFYYLNLTDYAGIGLVESTLVVTYTLFEIPTGAIADIIGKKFTIIVAFLFEAIGGYLIINAGGLNTLIISVFIMCVGGTLYSGTIDALIYDSLKQVGNEARYKKIIANITSISLLSHAVCSIVGGYLYLIHPTLPYWGNFIGVSTGLIFTFFIIEPKIDTVKFTFSNYINQTKQGYLQLIKTVEIKWQVITLVMVGGILTITSEMLDSFLGIEFGFKATQMGTVWAIILILSALVSQYSTKLKQVSNHLNYMYIVGILIAITLILSPVVGLVFGFITLLARISLQGVFYNLSSEEINDMTESKYRATTISTFNMIKNLPYLLSAYFIGTISDIISAKMVSFYLGLVLVVLLGFSLIRLRRNATIQTI
jgi:MFS family permease